MTLRQGLLNLALRAAPRHKIDWDSLQWQLRTDHHVHLHLVDHTFLIAKH